METKNENRNVAITIFEKETTSTMKRLLLPFTHGIDEQAIDNVLRFAKASDVTLVALALISAPDASYREQLRPERIEKATDFLETIVAQASFYGVKVEQQEAYTLDVTATIKDTLQAAECQGILLIVKEQGPCLLQVDEVGQLQQDLNINFYHLYAPKKAKKMFAFR